MSRVRIMSHLIAGYPSDEGMFAAARGLVEGGATYLEIQIPFSDPSADGPAIQKACSDVLSRGYRVAQGMKAIRDLKTLYPQVPMFIMTYANLAYRIGIESFVALAQDSGAEGLIIPDLPFDADEGLNAACERYGITSVIVAAPSMSAERIEKMTRENRPYIYAALRAGITGEETHLDESILSFIETVRGSSRVLGGFGISTGQQAAVLAPHVDAVVVGSAFVRLIASACAEGPEAITSALKEKMQELTGYSQHS